MPSPDLPPSSPLTGTESAFSPLDMMRRLEGPLNTLTGLTTTVKDETFGPLTGQQHQLLERIIEGTEEVAQLVEDLIRDMSRQKARTRPVRLLIVDDDPANLEILTIVLRTNGYEVEIAQAENAPAAVAMAREFKPDLVFMDIRMAGEYDGLEATRRLKADPDFRGVIVLVSALASEADQQAGRAAGADAYLTKPYMRKDIVEMLDRFADHLPAAKLKPEAQRERFT
jgi:two-component system, OmpR family, phosphate regulon response regulator PhoB